MVGRSLDPEARQQLLEATNRAYAALRADREAWAAVCAERAEWDSTLQDGLEDDALAASRVVKVSASGE